DDCNRKTRLCVGSAKTRLMATDETEKQQKQNPEPFRVGSVSAKNLSLSSVLEKISMLLSSSIFSSLFEILSVKR
ncbi:MAG: hypothetical protein QW177_09185, partial [Candidatus Nitrosotenuis sp.]